MGSKKSLYERPQVIELRNEARNIGNFVFSELVASESVTPVKDIFAAYQVWLKARKMPPTLVSLDGFGRLFPKGFRRKIVARKDEKPCRAVIGLGFRD